jgi:hypothetical protein
MQIKLTTDEKALFDTIRWDTPRDFREALQNGERAATLVERLLERGAILEVRRRYFTDAEMNSGLKKSRMQVFIDNGTSGRDILSHPNFLKYLRYFVCGPDLPEHVVEEFRQRAAEPFGDAEQLRALARGRARELLRGGRRRPEGLEEEFFKLATECGLDVGEAKLIRKDVMNVSTSERRR